MYYDRTLERPFKKAQGQFPVLLVVGSRQVGKTTFLRHLREKERSYVTLDDPVARELAKTDPGLFLQRFTPPTLIDEIQYAPELLPHIKMRADRQREAGMFWLTGSQQFHLMRGISESLAGRVVMIHLMGFSRRELLKQAENSLPFLPTPDHLARQTENARPTDLKDLYRTAWRGMLPAIATNVAMDWNLFYSSYVQTYLQRDIRDLARVGDEMAFLRFLRTVAARTGTLLNVSDLARDADVSPNTAKNWLSMLQTSGLVFLLEPYHANPNKRLVKQPKLYFLDTGLCAYLTGWTSPETLEAGAMSGPMFETWIITEILKSYCHQAREPRLYFYRDKDQKEIDLLIIQDGTVYPLEFKKTASPRRDMVRHFSVLNKFDLRIGPGGVICLAPELMPLDDRTQCIPVSAI